MRLWIAVLLIAACLVPTRASAQQKLDEMSLERWKKLREVERYQLQIAEKYYREKNWKVAAPEYEKYLTLYESSEAAAYAQLKWSLCVLNQRKANTAIKEGFQSVIDYWPDMPEAVAASYYIARTYKNIGQVTKAKKAYKSVLGKHKGHVVAVYSMSDLLEIAAQQKDDDARLQYWKTLTFDVTRTKVTRNLCVQASQQLASHYFYEAAFGEGLEALKSTYPEEQVDEQVVNYVRRPLQQMTADEERKVQGQKLADQAIAYLRRRTSEAKEKELQLVLWHHVAALQAAANRIDETPKTYNMALTRFGVNDETLGRLAGWYKNQRKFDLARQTYRRFVDPIEGLNQVAYSYREEQKYQLAVGIYQQLLGRDPDDLIRWKSEIGASYRAARKYSEAIAIYEQLIGDDAEHSNSWRWQIATAHQDAGQYKQAIGHFRQCTNFPENYKQMAWCHRRLKQQGEALVLYNQIIGGHPSSAPWAALQVGYTREEAGQKEKAILAFQQVCRKYPKNSYASQAHAHLQTKYKISVTLGGAKDE